MAPVRVRTITFQMAIPTCTFVLSVSTTSIVSSLTLRRNVALSSSIGSPRRQNRVWEVNPPLSIRRNCPILPALNTLPQYTPGSPHNTESKTLDEMALNPILSANINLSPNPMLSDHDIVPLNRLLSDDSMSPNFMLTDDDHVSPNIDFLFEVDPEYAPSNLPFQGNDEMSLPITPSTLAPLLDLGYGSAETSTQSVTQPHITTSQPGLGATGALKVSPTDYAPYICDLWPEPRFEVMQSVLFYMSLYLAVKNTCLPNYMKARIPILSQMKCDNWDQALLGYWNVATFLRHGWPGSYTAPVPPTPTPKNHRSVLAFAPHVDEFLHKEVNLGAMLGRFHPPPLPV